MNPVPRAIVLLAALACFAAAGLGARLFSFDVYRVARLTALGLALVALVWAWDAAVVAW